MQELMRSLDADAASIVMGQRQDGVTDLTEDKAAVKIQA